VCPCLRVPPLLDAHVHALQQTAGNHADSLLLRRPTAPFHDAPGQKEERSGPASPPTQPSLLVSQIQALQQTAGNRAVASLVGTPTVARRAASAAKENPNDYVDLLNGIGDITEASAHHGSGLGNVHFGVRLSPRHRDLLQNLRVALILMYSGQPGNRLRALALFEPLETEFGPALRRAEEVGIPVADIAAVRKQLNYLSEQLIRPAAYHEAHDEALAHSDLKSPDLVFQQERLEKAEKEFEAGQQMAEETTKLTGEAVTQIAIGESGMGKDLVELVRLPGSIKEKLDWAKKNGYLAKTATAAELVSKILGGANTVANVSFTVCERYAHAQHALALVQGATQQAERWEKVATGWGEKLRALDRIGRVLGVIGAIADGLKLIRAIIRGDWEEALNEAGSVMVDVMGVLGAADAGPLLGGITIVIKAEIAALSDAAAFIRWCREETVRDAAEAFIVACDQVAKASAFDFVADAELLFDPSHATLSDIAGKQLMLHASYLKKGLSYIGSQLNSSEKNRLGGQPQLVAALGESAVHALSNPLDTPDDPLTLAEQVRDVFAGANAMAQYVRKSYPTGDNEAAKAD